MVLDLLFAFKENNGSGRELGEARASYEGDTAVVQLMSELRYDCIEFGL